MISVPSFISSKTINYTTAQGVIPYRINYNIYQYSKQEQPPLEAALVFRGLFCREMLVIHHIFFKRCNKDISATTNTVQNRLRYCDLSMPKTYSTPIIESLSFATILK